MFFGDSLFHIAEHDVFQPCHRHALPVHGRAQRPFPVAFFHVFGNIIAFLSRHISSAHSIDLKRHGFILCVRCPRITQILSFLLRYYRNFHHLSPLPRREPCAYTSQKENTYPQNDSFSHTADTFCKRVFISRIYSGVVPQQPPRIVAPH